MDRTAIRRGCLTFPFQYTLRSNGWNSRLEVGPPVLRYKREPISPRKRLIIVFLFIFTQTFSWKYPSQHLPIMSGSVTSSHNEHFNSLWECLDLTERRPNRNNEHLILRCLLYSCSLLHSYGVLLIIDRSPWVVGDGVLPTNPFLRARHPAYLYRTMMARMTQVLRPT